MGKQTTTGNQASRVIWDNLEEWVRKKVQEFIQSLLEKEVTALLVVVAVASGRPEGSPGSRARLSRVDRELV